MLMPSLWALAAAVLLAGVFQAVVMVTRSLALREKLRADLHPAGYSMMYAVQGVGYCLCAAMSAVILSGSTPVWAVLAGAALSLALTLVCAFAPA